MVYTRFLGFTLLLLGCVLFALEPCCAEKQPPEPGSPEAIAQTSKQLDLDPEGRHMQRLISGGQPPDFSTYNRKVIKHIRGSSGIPLPGKAELEAMIEQEAVHIIEQHLLEEEKKETEEYLQVEYLPRCTQSRTLRSSTGYKSTTDGKQLLFDMLFVDSLQRLPREPDEVFGVNTVVRPYNFRKPGASTYDAVGLEITCLPSRVRATKEFILVDEGLNALKNYDKDPYGQGHLDFRMRNILDNS